MRERSKKLTFTKRCVAVCDRYPIARERQNMLRSLRENEFYENMYIRIFFVQFNLLNLC